MFRRLSCLLSLIFTGMAVLPAAADGEAMRWRVCTDRTSGVTFRYPYSLLPWDQMGTVLYERDILIAAKQGPLKPGQRPPRVWLRSSLVAELREAVRADRTAIAYHLASSFDRRVPPERWNWTPLDYYAESPQRPFAAAKAGPPAGIVGLAGSQGSDRTVVWFHGDRASALTVQGDDPAADAILDSFEVLVPGTGREPASSWRERRGRSVVFAADGAEVSGTRKPVPWDQHWEAETGHYHVTGQLSPTRLLQHARNLEALHDTYSRLFEPERISPFKFEVHVFNDLATFQRTAEAYGHGFTLRPGELVGGFFVPDLQSLWVYEESGRLGGPDMAIEHVMAHECSHQFLHMACNGSAHVPTWLNEGIAVHFENGRLGNGSYTHAPPTDRIQRLKQIYRQTKTTLVPLEQYLDHRGGIPADSYAEVYAMMHFWVFGAPGGRKRFVEYWKAMKAGEDGGKAFERIFMQDLIKAQGSRADALRVWREQLVRYVLQEL